MAREAMQAVATFAKRNRYYLRVKINGGATVLLDVTETGESLMGDEVSKRDGDIGIGIYGVIRSWVKVLDFDWYEGKLNEVEV
jgi:hypothetical protein